MKYTNIREEELKNKVAQDYFCTYDCSKIIGNVDFCVAMLHSESELFEQESLLWAEAKKGSADIYTSAVQLILTIGKARSFDRHMPPPFLGAFDGEKIAFVPYADIHEVFYQNDFNWNVTPSNHGSKEFQSLLAKVTATIQQKALLYHFGRDDKDLERFIKNNFQVGKFGVTKIKIDKNNFMVVYNKWLKSVKPTIAANWDIAKKSGIIDGDFYLADLLSQENKSLKDKLFVLLKNSFYELDRQIDAAGFLSSKTIQFNDNQIAHTQFWNKYERPPKREYWDYVVERRDLLVPQDVRERKGSYFTPQVWVELSQKYITDVLGEDWQDEYYVWDCAAGTGNLLFGLTNKYNVWASTLDTQDVEVMRDRIKNGANLLESHVFQFDFLNDEFNKLPQPLQDIINDPEKRKKLVIYINPPYAEHGNRTTISDNGKHKTDVAKLSKVYEDFHNIVGTGARELFVQFFLRIYRDMPEAHLASFSTLKFVNSQNFSKFRTVFKANYEAGFICNANSFDNVKGNFPIGFSVWDLGKKLPIGEVKTDIPRSSGDPTPLKKLFYAFESKFFISTWLRNFYDKTGSPIGYIILPGVDMQQQSGVYFTVQPTESDVKQHKTAAITRRNLSEMSVYLAVRQAIELTWINNKDPFLFPNPSWMIDTVFQSDCLTFVLFHGQNKVTVSDGINHWIPFTENEINAKEKFASNFMSNYLKGKIKLEDSTDLFSANELKTNCQVALKFSPEATAVFDAGRVLWTYYHSQPQCNVNSSLYDIREHFQGRNNKGKMNNKSTDEVYSGNIAALRIALKLLAQKIEPKVYEHRFLL